jgi:Ca-activated chloride channel homolog
MILLLALLFAAPERVVIVAKEPHASTFWPKAKSAVSAAVRRLHEKADPDVDRGNSLSAADDPEGALKAYDRALARSADSPEIRFDRARTLLNFGAESAPEAAREASFALEKEKDALKPAAAFNIGLANEAMGKPDEAIAAYQKALALDPQDVDSKVNLELLLRSNEERKKSIGQPQAEKDPQKGQSKEQQKSQGPDDKRQEQKSGSGEDEQKKTPSGESREQKEARGKERTEPQAADKPVDRSEAERLLDALRADEKNLQTWRFAKEKTKERRRGAVEKDW